MKTHIEQTKEMIAVMQAFIDGKEIEMKFRDKSTDRFDIVDNPRWNMDEFEYRIRQIQDTVDKSHISSEYKFMARNQDGGVYVHTRYPETNGKRWSSMHSARVTSPSYVRGSTDWKESVVELC